MKAVDEHYRNCYVGSTPKDDGNHLYATNENKLFPWCRHASIVREAYKNPSLVYRDGPATQPPAVTIVIYDWRLVRASTSRDIRTLFRSDGYKYGAVKGTKLVGTKDAEYVIRSYRHLFDPDNTRGDSVFRRYEVTLPDDECGLVLFHYAGDDSKAKEVSVRERCRRNRLKLSNGNLQFESPTTKTVINASGFITAMLEFEATQCNVCGEDAAQMYAMPAAVHFREVWFNKLCLPVEFGEDITNLQRGRTVAVCRAHFAEDAVVRLPNGDTVIRRHVGPKDMRPEDMRATASTTLSFVNAYKETENDVYGSYVMDYAANEETPEFDVSAAFAVEGQCHRYQAVMEVPDCSSSGNVEKRDADSATVSVGKLDGGNQSITNWQDEQQMHEHEHNWRTDASQESSEVGHEAAEKEAHFDPVVCKQEHISVDLKSNSAVSEYCASGCESDQLTCTQTSVRENDLVSSLFGDHRNVHSTITIRDLSNVANNSGLLRGDWLQSDSEKHGRAIAPTDSQSSIYRKRSTDVEEVGTSTLRSSATSEMNSVHSPMIHLVVREGHEISAKKIKSQGEVNNNGPQKRKPIITRKKFFIVEANRLIQLFKWCTHCGWVVKYVELSHSDAVPKLTWECTGECGISDWTGLSDQ